jgi:hypothetical protein
MPAKRGQKKTRKTVNSKPQPTPVTAATTASSGGSGVADVTVTSKKSKAPLLSMAENARARYPYVRMELKRIGILAGGMLVLLIVLFVILSQ